MRRSFSVISRLTALAGLVGVLAHGAQAQIRLTEVMTEATTSTGDYIGGYDWHTSSLPSNAYNLWIIEGTDINGAFINGPDSSHSSINIPLSLGAHTFTIYGSANYAEDGSDPRFPKIDYYAINFAFNGSGSTAPAISALAPVWSGGPMPFAANTSSSIRFYDPPLVPATPTLSYTVGDETVTLTNFFYTASDYYGINRVSDYTTSPGGGVNRNDNIGQFTLLVTQNVAPVSAAPEPTPMALLLLGLGGMFIVTRSPRLFRRL